MINYFTLGYKPVFVYGSLMSGLGNHSVIASDVIGVANGSVSGVEMFAYGTAFPFAFAGEGTVVGELSYLDEFTYAASMRSLDDLEGYSDSDRDLYKRVTVMVTTTDGAQAEAWMYLGDEDMREYLLSEAPRVLDGNWREYQRNN